MPHNFGSSNRICSIVSRQSKKKRGRKKGSRHPENPARGSMTVSPAQIAAKALAARNCHLTHLSHTNCLDAEQYMVAIRQMALNRKREEQLSLVRNCGCTVIEVQR